MSKSDDGQAITEVDEFIRRQRNLEITIDDRAANIIFKGEGEYKKGITLANALGKSLSKYIILRDSPYPKSEYSEVGTQENWRKNSYALRVEAAKEVLIWIAKAYSHNVIKVGSSALAKLEECREKSQSIKERCEELERAHHALQIKHEQLMLDFKYLEGQRDKLEEKLRGMFKSKTVLSKSGDNPDADVWNEGDKV